MRYRALLATATLTLVWSTGAQAQAKAPTTATVSRPAVNPSVAQTKAPVLSSSSSTAAFLPSGNYTLSMTFTKVNGVTEARHATTTIHLTHSGAALTVGSAHTDLSGSTSVTHLSLAGSRSDGNLGSVTLTLNGSQTTDGAGGTVTAAASGQNATGTFTLTPVPLATAHMVKWGSFTCDDHCEEIILAAIAILAL